MVASPIAPESSLDAVATVYYCDTRIDAIAGASGVLPNGWQGASNGTAEYGSLRLIVAPQADVSTEGKSSDGQRAMIRPCFDCEGMSAYAAPRLGPGSKHRHYQHRQTRDSRGNRSGPRGPIRRGLPTGNGDGEPKVGGKTLAGKWSGHRQGHLDEIGGASGYQRCDDIWKPTFCVSGGTVIGGDLGSDKRWHRRQGIGRGCEQQQLAQHA